MSRTSPTCDHEEISSESYMRPSGENLPEARWPQPLIMMRVTTRIRTWTTVSRARQVRILWILNFAAQVANEMRRNDRAVLAGNLQKQIEWIWLSNTSNRRVGGVLWTWVCQCCLLISKMVVDWIICNICKPRLTIRHWVQRKRASGSANRRSKSWEPTANSGRRSSWKMRNWRTFRALYYVFRDYRHIRRRSGRGCKKQDRQSQTGL